MRWLPLIVLLFSGCALTQTPDPTPVDGRVTGTVVTEDGKPVSGATVYLSEEASSLVDALSIATHSNAAGHFDFGRKLKHGRYEIYALNEKDGYPDPTSKFYRPLNFNPQYVQLFGDHPAEKVTVELKDQGAILSGKTFDGETGRPLRGRIGVMNLRTEGGRGTVAEKGMFQELVPANTDLLIVVEYGSPDQVEWSIFTTKVSLEPGEKMNLDVPLFRKASPAPSPE